ncbi:MAG: fasciclin domain-containing protein [Deltaproteobacteria bacterium]|nr:fasciclin domain-containing protein [Deltaproteobacteria bacterium]
MKKLVVACVLAFSTVAVAQLPGLKDLGKAVEKDAKKAEKDAKKEADKAAKEVAKDVKEAVKVDVVDTALASGKFTKLVAALQAAGLVEELKKPGPFTVFAPSDDAFNKIPAAELEALLKDKDRLSAVLKGHVVAGKHMSKDLKAHKAKTLSGSDVEVTVKAGKIGYGGAQVSGQDIDCTNGVIHVIDTVVFPAK